MEKRYPSTLAGEAEMTRRLDITLRQNLDEQIVIAEKRVAELKVTKERLEKSGILDSRIDDIYQAMR
jgi:hypothetical protein